MKENTELDELQRRLHDAHESSAMLRKTIDVLEAENDPDYYKEAAARIKRETAQTHLL